jgi:hypothetical protein
MFPQNTRLEAREQDGEILLRYLSAGANDAVAVPSTGAVLSQTYWLMVVHFAQQFNELSTLYFNETGNPPSITFDIRTATPEQIAEAEAFTLELISMFAGVPIDDQRANGVIRNNRGG